MNVRVMDTPAHSTEDAVRRSLPLFRAGGGGKERRALVWPAGGRYVWILETPGLNEPLCPIVVRPAATLSLDYHYAESQSPSDQPVEQDFHPVLRRWLD